VNVKTTEPTGVTVTFDASNGASRGAAGPVVL